MNSKLVCLFVLIAAAYTSAELVVEKEIEKVPLKIFPAGVNPLLCPNYPDCNNALLHSRKVFYPDYLHSGLPALSPYYNSAISPYYSSALSPYYSPAVRSIYNTADPTFYHPGRILRGLNW